MKEYGESEAKKSMNIFKAPLAINSNTQKAPTAHLEIDHNNHV